MLGNRGHGRNRAGRQPVSAHSHMWLVGVLGVAVGLALMILVPKLEAVAGVVLLVAGLHLAGAAVALTSLWAMGGDRLWGRLSRRHENKSDFDFGWTPAWVAGPAIAALVAVSLAIVAEVAAPAWWPLSLALMLLAAACFAGSLFSAAGARRDYAVLPMVDLLAGEEDRVLDAGCGAGRTSIALGRVLNRGRIVALDSFDADYIADGGRALLERNLARAGLAGCVDIEQGDLRQLPFADASFDSAVSAHAMDHLGRDKVRGLSEMLRVLKPGGRFLLVVWVPGWTMFAVANLLSLFLTTPEGWRRMAAGCGFERLDEGVCNGVWFVLLGKPGPRATDRPVRGPHARIV